METITLSLRQRKLLNLIQNQTSHITGQTLARQLNVSPRTIRSDIVEINHALASCGASISAERSKGYFLECSDPESFQEQFKTDDLLLTKEDRIRYLTFQLCLSDVPLNQYKFPRISRMYELDIRLRKHVKPFQCRKIIV